MSEAKLKKQLSKADGIVVRRLLLSDVESVVSCFQRCYGGTYPVDGFSNPELLRELITQERLHSVVAVTGDGTVVGHMGLRSRTPDARTAEAGNTVVDPRYRGHHLSTRLGIALTVLATEHGLVGTHGYPTTAHPVIQKLEVAGGGIECGVLLDYIPAETEYVGLATAPARQRLAVVVIYRPLSVAPARRVWLPRRHRALAESLYARARLTRETLEGGTELPVAASVLRTSFEARRNVTRVEVEVVGRDLRDRIEAEASEHPVSQVFVDLPLCDAATNPATEALNHAGFFFGALLPEYRSTGDVLRLQRPSDEPTLPKLATSAGQGILAYVLGDRRRP